MQDCRDVAQRLHFVEIVRCHDDGGATGPQQPDVRPDGVPRLGVNTERRLVDDQQLRLMQQRPGEGHPAAHAARQAGHHIVGPVSEVDQLKNLCDPLDGPGQRVQRGGEPQVLGDGQLFIERVLLQDHSDAAPQPGAPGRQVLPEHPGGSLEGAVKPGHHAEQRALPRAVGAQHPSDPGWLDFQVDPVQGLPAPTPARNAGQPDHGGGRSGSGTGASPIAVQLSSPRTRHQGWRKTARRGRVAGMFRLLRHEFPPCGEAPGQLNEVSPYE